MNQATEDYDPSKQADEKEDFPSLDRMCTQVSESANGRQRSTPSQLHLLQVQQARSPHPKLSIERGREEKESDNSRFNFFSSPP